LPLGVAIAGRREPIFEAAALVAAVGFGRAVMLLLAGRFAVRDDFRLVFAGFDFDLVVAICSP
jgi:hypothetical protein